MMTRTPMHRTSDLVRCALLLLPIYACTASSIRRGAVIKTQGRLTFSDDDSRPEAIAVGTFRSSRDTKSGWAQLYVKTRANASDHDQMQAAGYLEGFLTASEISSHHINMKSYFNLTTDRPAKWLVEQYEWSKQQVATNQSAFWSMLGLLLSQHTGIMEGYWAAANQSRSVSGPTLPKLSVEDFLSLSAVGAHMTSPPDFTGHQHHLGNLENVKTSISCLNVWALGSYE